MRNCPMKRSPKNTYSTLKNILSFCHKKSTKITTQKTSTRQYNHVVTKLLQNECLPDKHLVTNHQAKKSYSAKKFKKVINMNARRLVFVGKGF